MLLPDALLRAVFDQADVSMALVDGRGVLSMWNSAFESLFQTLAGVGPGRLAISFFDFVGEREGARLGYYASEILIGGTRSASVETPIRAADGTIHWLGLSLSRIEPLPDGQGERFLMFVAQDITERVHRENSLKEARDEAEKATHTKSQFLANMSHEIRTPIQTILGDVELLRETVLDTEQAEYVDQVRFSADVLLGLINDILDFSKIEAGRLELETTSFDLRTWVYQSVDLLAMEANRKRLEIIVDVDDELPALVSGDSARLRQVIVNLLKNAVNFTPEGGVSLRLRRIPSLAGPRVRFEVADTGPGIPDSKREMLFTPFYQGELSQSRRTGGTGLGLAISRHLVELMGGSIGLLPEGVGQGAVFWFELPLNAPEYSAPPKAGASGSGARILIVDDYSPTRAFAGREAAAAGYRVSEAGSGEAALEELRRAAAAGDPFSVCLIDQNMPKMDGWRLASEITRDTAINGARLILMASVGTIGGDAKMKLLRWFNGYISKPIKPGELLEALGGALSSEVDLEAAEAGLAAAQADAERHFHGNVLLAEDHEVNRELFTLLLGRLGCGVVTAQDGVEAVEIGSSRRFDLVLMDIFMPRMSGYDASRALRDRGFSGPIIAVTASALKGERENCLAAGMNDILVKPFKKDDLAAILAEYLPAGAETAAAGGETSAVPAIAVPAASHEPDSSVLDWTGVLDTFLGQTDTVKSLLRRFREKAKAQIEELAQALGDADAGKIMEISHSLKGAAWNLCATRLGDAALLGETAGREGDLEASSRALEAIRAAFGDFDRAAAAHLES